MIYRKHHLYKVNDNIIEITDISKTKLVKGVCIYGYYVGAVFKAVQGKGNNKVRFINKVMPPAKDIVIEHLGHKDKFPEFYL